MTHDTKRAPRRAAIPGMALAALLLAGCSAGHVGEDWQCPLAEGGSCDSVAAADPAVPGPKAADTAVLAEPLWRVRAGGRVEPAPETGTPCEAGCAAFDPVAWLARLFGEGGGGVHADAVASAPVPAGAEPGADDATAAALAAEPGPSQGNPDAADLRTGEAVARIWIAPFVDADGIYREAAWVRVVLEPAGWRLP